MSKSLRDFATAIRAMSRGVFHVPNSKSTGKSEKNVTHPVFTESELNEVRSLPKKEREQRVKELRAKYRGAE